MNVRSCSRVIISVLVLTLLLMSFVYADSGTYYPDGVGVTTQLSPSGAANNWDCVEETPPNDATDYVYNALDATLQIDTYAVSIGIPDGSTINSVTVYWRARYRLWSSGSATCNGKAIVRVGSTNYGGASSILTSSWVTRSYIWTNSPATGSAWTESEVENIEIGVGLYSQYSWRRMAECTQVYVVIDWTPGTPTKEWHNIAQWNFNLTTRQWQTVASLDFNLSTMAWFNITSWNFQLQTKSWQNLASWSFNILTRVWHPIAQWDFIINVFGWHNIAHWIFKIGPESNMPILFVGVLSFTVLIILILYCALKEK